MSVEELNVVDITSIDKRTGQVVLSITDHLDWCDSVKHQITLQKKLNAYLAFVESGELLQRFPDAEGRPVALNIVFKFKPDADGLRFLERAKQVVQSAGCEMRYELFAESYDN
jgi:hypothetical protein